MPLDPKRVKEVFLAAAEKANAEDRNAFLDEACGGDAELRHRVEGLLQAHDASGGWLGSPDPVPVEETRPHSPEVDPGATTDHSGERPGTVLACRYKLLEQIGEGGMGTVWVAEQTQPVRRKVAVKLIKAGMDSKAVLARFEQERQALAVRPTSGGRSGKRRRRV